MNTEIEIPIDELNKEVYRFYFNESKMTLVLQFYAKYTRQTKRHSFKADKWYDRLNKRGSDLKVSEVPFGETIQFMAMNAFTSKISVKKDNE